MKKLVVQKIEYFKTGKEKLVKNKQWMNSVLINEVKWTPKAETRFF